jgi:hypothetical protein
MKTLNDIATKTKDEYRCLLRSEQIERGDLHSLDGGVTMNSILNESTIGDVPASFALDRTFWRKMRSEPIETGVPLEGENFIAECEKLLLEVNSYDSDTSRLGYRLFRAVEKLKLVIDHAERQFDQSDMDARFTREFVNNLKRENQLI